MPEQALVQVADAIRRRTLCQLCIVETARLADAVVTSALEQLTTMLQTYARAGRCEACKDERVVYRLYGT